MRWHVPLLLAASVTVSGAIAAHAAPAPAKRARASTTRHAAKPAPKPAAASPVTAATPGMVIGLDPDTRAPGMPTPEQLARLSAARPQATIPAPVHHPDGSISLDCRNWMREHFVVSRTATGRLVPACVDGHEQARRAMQQPPVTPAEGEER